MELVIGKRRLVIFSEQDERKEELEKIIALKYGNFSSLGRNVPKTERWELRVGLLPGGKIDGIDAPNHNKVIRVRNLPTRKRNYYGWWDLEAKRGRLLLSRHLNDFHVINFFLNHIFGAQLVKDGGLLIHSSSLIINGRSFLFMGKPGAGKSTIRMMAAKYLTLGDDTSVIEKNKGRYHHYPSPFHSEDYVVPILGKYYLPKAMFMIQKSEEDALEPVSQKEAVVKLMTQVRFLPAEEEMLISPGVYTSFLPKAFLADLFNPCWEFVQQVPVYRLLFTKSPKFLQVIKRHFFK